MRQCDVMNTKYSGCLFWDLLLVCVCVPQHHEALLILLFSFTAAWTEINAMIADLPKA